MFYKKEKTMTINDMTTDDALPQTPVTIITNSARFALGQIVATPGALVLLQATGRSAASLLARHMHADFGDTCRDDSALNELAITDGSRIMSVYRLVDAEKLKATPKQKRADLPTVWVITDGTNSEGEREYTTLLLPRDY
jgi:hypothetical protein